MNLVFIWEQNHGRDLVCMLTVVDFAVNIVAAISWIFICGEHKVMDKFSFVMFNNYFLNVLNYWLPKL